MTTTEIIKPSGIAIHESKQSDKVIKFIELSVNSLSKYCSINYAKRIIAKNENNSLWGIYFTKSGRIKAVFY